VARVLAALPRTTEYAADLAALQKVGVYLDELNYKVSSTTIRKDISKIIVVDGGVPWAWKVCGVDTARGRPTGSIAASFTCGVWQLFHFLSVAPSIATSHYVHGTSAGVVCGVGGGRPSYPATVGVAWATLPVCVDKCWYLMWPGYWLSSPPFLPPPTTQIQPPWRCTPRSWKRSYMTSCRWSLLAECAEITSSRTMTPAPSAAALRYVRVCGDVTSICISERLISWGGDWDDWLIEQLQLVISDWGLTPSPPHPLARTPCSSPDCAWYHEGRPDAAGASLVISPTQRSEHKVVWWAGSGTCGPAGSRPVANCRQHQGFRHGENLTECACELLGCVVGGSARLHRGCGEVGHVVPGEWGAAHPLAEKLDTWYQENRGPPTR